MKSVFLDANVFLDAWLQRGSLFPDAQALLTAGEKRSVVLHTSASILVTTIYFLKKDSVPYQTIIALLDDVLRVTSLVSPTEKAFRQGLYAGFSDLEDGVQYHTALQSGTVDYFVTNNAKDYRRATSVLPVLTPKQFMAL